MDFHQGLHALTRAAGHVTERRFANSDGDFATTVSCRTHSDVRYRCFVSVARNGRTITQRKLWAVVVPEHRTKLTNGYLGFVKVGHQALHITKRG